MWRADILLDLDEIDKLYVAAVLSLKPAVLAQIPSLLQEPS